MRSTSLLLVLLGGCSSTSDPAEDPACSSSADADADGLDDCAELDLGLDPNTADSDGDGVADGEEIDCTSDPLDAAEQCYACGWPHGDPGTLESTGSGTGDVIANLSLVDQCGEQVDLWDFTGKYYILFLTAAW